MDEVFRRTERLKLNRCLGFFFFNVSFRACLQSRPRASNSHRSRCIAVLQSRFGGRLFQPPPLAPLRSGYRDEVVRAQHDVVAVHSSRDPGWPAPH